MTNSYKERPDNHVKMPHPMEAAVSGLGLDSKQIDRLVGCYNAWAAGAANSDGSNSEQGFAAAVYNFLHEAPTKRSSTGSMKPELPSPNSPIRILEAATNLFLAVHVSASEDKFALSQNVIGNVINYRMYQNTDVARTEEGKRGFSKSA